MWLKWIFFFKKLQKSAPRPPLVVHVVVPVCFLRHLSKSFLEQNNFNSGLSRLLASDGVLEYSTRTRVPFFEYSYSEPQVLGWYSYSKVNVLGQKKRRVLEYIWPSLKVINKMNF